LSLSHVCRGCSKLAFFKLWQGSWLFQVFTNQLKCSVCLSKNVFQKNVFCLFCSLSWLHFQAVVGMEGFHCASHDAPAPSGSGGGGASSSSAGPVAPVAQPKAQQSFYGFLF
jgi:hypothetical protein